MGVEGKERREEKRGGEAGLGEWRAEGYFS